MLSGSWFQAAGPAYEKAYSYIVQVSSDVRPGVPICSLLVLLGCGLLLLLRDIIIITAVVVIMYLICIQMTLSAFCHTFLLSTEVI